MNGLCVLHKGGLERAALNTRLTRQLLERTPAKKTWSATSKANDARGDYRRITDRALSCVAQTGDRC